MKNSLKNSLLLMIIFSTVGCRKDPHIVVEQPVVDNPCIEENCEELSPPGPPGAGEVFDDQYIIQGVQYMTPCFNPNNPNEFIYIRRGVQPAPELVKYNISTEQEQIILYPMSLGRPQWSKDGWIVFVYNNKRIWRIYEDGSGLQELTTGIDDKYPTFNYSGDRVFYYRDKHYTNSQLQSNPDLYNEYKIMVVDIGGNVIDSVTAANIMPGNYYQKWQFAAHDPNGRIYFEGGSGSTSGFYELNNELDSVSPNMIHSLYPFSGWIRDLVYSNGFIYYTKFENGLYKANVTTGVESQIKVGCKTRYYDYISISPNGDKLLVQKITQKRIDYYTVDVQNDIWLFDLNTCEATKILAGD